MQSRRKIEDSGKVLRAKEATVAVAEVMAVAVAVAEVMGEGIRAE
jgi:hypothetical protein